MKLTIKKDARLDEDYRICGEKTSTAASLLIHWRFLASFTSAHSPPTAFQPHQQVVLRPLLSTPLLPRERSFSSLLSVRRRCRHGGGKCTRGAERTVGVCRWSSEEEVEENNYYFAENLLVLKKKKIVVQRNCK
jgi:hypothetical protein